ncbi:MAG: SDR family NAD(P)-dependent oxidoreductase [Dehalococcoidia bacterium]
MNEVVAIVAGGDRAHGAGVVRALTQGGARVVVTAPPGEALATGVPTSDGVVAVEGDIATASAAEEAVKAALDQIGRLDLVVVNPARRLPVLGDITAEVDRAVESDLRAAYTMLKHATIVFRQQRNGRAVILCPREGLTGSDSSPVQAAIAGGLVGLTKAVSLGMSRYEVPCNAVAFDEVDAESAATLEALVGYLAVEASPQTTGHVFGVTGRTISLWAHERPIGSIFDASGAWEVGDIEGLAPAVLSVDPLIASNVAVATARG